MPAAEARLSLRFSEQTLQQKRIVLPGRVAQKTMAHALWAGQAVNLRPIIRGACYCHNRVGQRVKDKTHPIKQHAVFDAAPVAKDILLSV